MMRRVTALFAAIAMIALGACGPAARPVPESEPLALVIVIDRSGSMSGLNLDQAKAGAAAAIAELGADDLAGIIVFDSAPTVVARLQKVKDGAALREAIAGIQPGGGTLYLPALVEAFGMLEPTALRKHVIFLSDGQGPYGGIPEVVAEMHAAGITISTIAVGDADEKLLQIISDGGTGRFYRADTAEALPAIFAKEVQAVRDPS